MNKANESLKEQVERFEVRYTNRTKLLDELKEKEKNLNDKITLMGE